MLISFPNDGRKLKKLIIGLLKSGLTSEIKRLNYIESYTLQEGKIEKKPEKIISFSTEHSEKVEQFLQKNFSEAKILSDTTQ
ncbi:MAG: hypothetical protein PHU61_00305 [Candidatus Absconditabacteria bacterium]|nr:hypothetical protein [Candidatus Absconditabacteria bacterium]MDD3868630.1 hypothetical protein [Candidatus Absconditabacteria bacterium]MDD4714150.1 hypothetical protein [Candidatus Absconditabacteria bacterium]